jgi:hypothetical protein
MPTIRPRHIGASLFITTKAIVDIQSLKKIADGSGRQKGRFEIYDFLKAIYRIYVRWKRRRIAKRSARALGNGTNIVRRKGMSPIRILIEAILPNADLKQKSRWVRALEYVYSENVSPSRLRKFIRSHGGIAGCARLAASVNRKRGRPGGRLERLDHRAQKMRSFRGPIVLHFLEISTYLDHPN